MQTIIVISLFFGSCLCYPDWGNQLQGQGGWSGAQGRSQGAGGAFGQEGQGWRGGRGANDDGQYGATIIDTPDMYGYEATIPGAHSKFVSYRGARSGNGAFGRANDQQGPQGQGQGRSGQRPWSQGGHQY